MAGVSAVGGPGVSTSASTATSGPPHYDTSFVFHDSNKLAKNAKRSYESQVCDLRALSDPRFTQLIIIIIIIMNNAVAVLGTFAPQPPWKTFSRSSIFRF